MGLRSIPVALPLCGSRDGAVGNTQLTSDLGNTSPLAVQRADGVYEMLGGALRPASSTDGGESEMLPRFAEQDMGNHLTANANALCDLVLSDSLQTEIVGVPDCRLSDFRQSALMHPVLDATRHTPFQGGVLNVALLGIQEQVGGVHTRAHIAAVANQKSVCRSDEPLVRDGVCSSLSAFKPECAVAVLEQGGSPKPTRPQVWADNGSVLVDLCPETFRVAGGAAYTIHVSASDKVLISPRAVASSAGASSCLNFTTPPGGDTMNQEVT